MRIFFIVALILLLSCFAKAQFYVSSPGNNYTLTCYNTAITMTATPPTGFSYTWTNGSSNLSGNYINLTQAGTWTVFGQDLSTFSVTTQTFTVAQNVNIPTVVVTPTVNNITCSGGSGCFTATSTGTNVTTNWFYRNH